MSAAAYSLVLDHFKQQNIHILDQKINTKFMFDKYVV